MSETSPPPRHHLDYLDGMRGVLALYVALHHLWIQRYGMLAHSGWFGYATNWMLYGHLSVDIFIVLSGFCLAIPVAKTDRLRGGTWDFYWRRARRILPPYFGCTLGMVLMILAFWAMHWTEIPFTAKGFLVNFLLLGELFPKELAQFNGVVWTVDVEWKIYFLFPLILYVLRRFSAWVSVAAMSALAAIYAAAIHAVAPDLSLKHICPWFLVLFLAGVLAGRVVFSDRPKPSTKALDGLVVGFGLLSLALLCLFPVTDQGEDHLFAPNLVFIDLAFGLFGASLLARMGLAELKEWPTRLIAGLSWKPIVFIGTFAYSLYLCHGGIYTFMRTMLTVVGRRLQIGAEGQSLIGFFVNLPIAVIGAYLFFLVFEKPFLRAKATPKES